MVLQVRDVPDNVVGIIAIFCIFVAFPIVIAFARSIWKRGSEPRQRMSDDTATRLTQMQNTLDSMAIEIERISEGQRFVTKLMAGREPAALPQKLENG